MTFIKKYSALKNNLSDMFTHKKSTYHIKNVIYSVTENKIAVLSERSQEFLSFNFPKLHIGPRVFSCDVIKSRYISVNIYGTQTDSPSSPDESASSAHTSFCKRKLEQPAQAEVTPQANNSRKVCWVFLNKKIKIKKRAELFSWLTGQDSTSHCSTSKGADVVNHDRPSL